MKNSSIEFIVQYADTDAYKVAWHGSYLRWMEAGRVDLLYKNNIDIKEMDEKYGVVVPVVEIDIKYKQSAKLFDEVVVETKVIDSTCYSMSFEQIIKNKNTGAILTTATVKGVALQAQTGKIFRKLDKIVNGEEV